MGAGSCRRSGIRTEFKLTRGKPMKNSLSHWGVVQIAICTGIVCAAVGFASNLAGVVYAQSCPHTIPFPSLCITTPFPECRNPDGSTAGCNTRSEWDNKSGEFQCMTWPLSYSTCFDSTNSTPCYNVYGCYMKYGFCIKNTDGANQPYSKVVKTWDCCAVE